jgi:hypothetical protein
VGRSTSIGYRCLCAPGLLPPGPSPLREHAAVKDRLMQVALAPRAGRKQVDAGYARSGRVCIRALTGQSGGH